MIEFDYLIERDNGDGKDIFRPRLEGKTDYAKCPNSDKNPKEAQKFLKKIEEKKSKILDNLTYIEAPNSFGKSTLLNILALGLHGLKNKRLNPSLRDKIKSLSESKHQKIKFSFNIANKDKTLLLNVEKPKMDKNEIIVKEQIKGKSQIILSKEAFERKYNLIYDIPDNPTQRLSQLVLDIKDAQIRYAYHVGILKENVRRIIGEIRNSRDPERIKSLQIEKDRYEEERDICIKTIEKYSKEVDLLECYTYYRFYEDYKDLIKRKQSKLEQVGKKEVKVQRRVHKENKEYYANLDYAKRTISEMQDIFNEVGMLLKLVLPKKEQTLLKIWEKIDLKQVITDFEFDSNLEESIISFKKILNEELEKLEKSESNKEAQMCTDLIDVLENYKNLNISVPGLNKTIGEFIKILKDTAEKNESILKKSENINNADAQLARLKRYIDGLNNQVLPTLRKLKPFISHHERADFFSESDEFEKNKLKEEIKNCQSSFEYYENHYAAKGKPSIGEIKSRAGNRLEEYSRYSETQLRDKIKDLKNKINTEKSNEKSITHTHNSISGELERLKNEEPHKYQNQLAVLNDLFETFNLLYSKLENDYKKYITEIEERGTSDSMSDEQKKYNEIVFNFLGRKIGKFRHIDKEYEAIKVDLLEGIIYTKENKIIHLTDMGTGQSQSAYLKGLLNTTDKRMIIAMFDEVAMMDDKSLKPIYDKFKELYDNGKLLVGIVVQKGNSVKILSKVSD